MRDEDGSVWADLREDGLDRKILLRSDGTSVYMTQDIGTAKMRFTDYPIDHMVYVVGNEQEYHFQVLSILLDKLGFPFGKELPPVTSVVPSAISHTSYSVKPKSIDFTGFDVFYLPLKQSR